jgi:hypothetical protein
LLRQIFLFHFFISWCVYQGEKHIAFGYKTSWLFIGHVFRKLWHSAKHSGSHL